MELQQIVIGRDFAVMGESIIGGVEMGMRSELLVCYGFGWEVNLVISMG